MLVDLARRYEGLLRPGDRLARLGGDEFGIVLRDIADADDAIERLQPLTRQDVEVSGLPLSVEASIGVALAPDDGDDVDQLLQRADVALYLAKAGRSGVVRYTAGDDHYDARNLELLADFRTGVEAGELVLHYQPKVSIPRGHVEAVEALVRWNHPRHGLLYPDSFVPLVEPTDLVDRLTEVVLASALRDMASIDPTMAIAVNVSARNLARADFARRVVAQLDDAGVSPTRLIVEITETALLHDPARAAAVLRELHAAGVRVSIDDFGQGQTSLNYLATLPVDELKIDKSFVSDMLTEPAHAAIVRSVVDLGHNLGLTVVAEGVETAPIHLALIDYGCDVAQGYLFARPMPFADLRAWLSGGVLLDNA
jgi:predicted signal transduction protein with EAL and GGDEF domain